MHGEIEYFSATSMYAAYQAGVEAVAPYVEAQDASGKWVRVMDDMGFPAGGPRTMTADLTDKLPQGTQRIRITTNLQIYWDNILINRAEQNGNARLTPVPLARADLRFHGFPLKIENQPPGNVLYVYEKTSPTGPYTRPAGAYTRYGDVRPLLTGYDDRLAVFGSGDEVVLDFDPAKLPALPKGWVRDYFFVANGYEKDMDFYAAEANTVHPLPFRSHGHVSVSQGQIVPAGRCARQLLPGLQHASPVRERAQGIPLRLSALSMSTVILSGVAASRSEAAAQSKDPYERNDRGSTGCALTGREKSQCGRST